jgi:HK97 family phage major capsid protein
MQLPLKLDPALRLSNDGKLNPLGALANQVTLVGTDTYRLPYTAGVTASWDAEATAVSDDTPTIAKSDIKAHRWQAFVPFSIELQTDAQEFAREMTRLLVDAADRLEATAFMAGTGDGNNQPCGLIPALDANTNVEVVVTTDGSFAMVDVFKVDKALPARFRPGAAWLATVGTLNEIRDEITGLASAEPVWSEGPDGPRLLSKRVYEVTDGLVDFTGSTAAQNLVVVGDFRSAYTVVRRAGTAIELVPHLLDTTNNRPTGERGYYAWGRTGGGTVVENAARLLQNQ